MKPGRLLLASVVLLTPSLVSARVVEATWTDAAKRVFVQRTQKQGQNLQLPEVRAFDSEGRPILRLMPAGTTTVAQVRDAARSGRVIAGATLEDVLSGFRLTAEDAPVRPAVGSPSLIVVDFWAEWCVPCKAVSRDLDRWVSEQPAGSVTLVRAETDFVAALRGE